MKFLGHRGVVTNKSEYFENTIQSFKYAIKYSDGIETDACLSSDGEIFLIHEKTKDAKYTIAPYICKKSQKILGDKRLDMLTAKQIDKLRLKNGEKIPKLIDTLKLFTNQPNKIINIELKSYNVEKALVLLLNKAFSNKIIKQQQVIISSFNHKQLADMKDIFPNVRTGALFDKLEAKKSSIYPWLNEDIKYKKPTIENIKEVQNDIDYLVIPYIDITSNLLKKIKNVAPNKKVIAWQSSNDGEADIIEFKKETAQFIEIIEAIILNNPIINNEEIYDIAIIGGGINGCGIARDASARGLKVYLCDKGGIGGETSCSSTKLIHGGLRYLENYDFKLVRKALKEREKLIKIAPNIISEARFILPHQKHLRPKWMIQAGVWLYDALAFPSTFAKSKAVSLKNNIIGKPLKNNITHGFSYSDARVDDHRLVILNALDAQNNGATIMPYTKCSNVKQQKGIWHITANKNTIKAKILINATGPWADSFANMQNINHKKRNLKHIKGSHIIVNKLFEHDSCYIFQDKNKRIVFALPYENNFTLIGTTEELVDNVEKPKCSKAERLYLCEVINCYFKKQISIKDIIWSYAGIRPIIDANSTDNRTASRDYTLDIANNNGAIYLNIWGGKLTTYRTLAEKALKMLTPYNDKLNNNIDWVVNTPLAGGDIPPAKLKQQLKADYPFLNNTIIERYSKSYGTICYKFLGLAKSEKDLGINFSNGLFQAEVDYLVNNEWAKTTDDILWKKTKLGLIFNNKQIAKLTKYLTN